MSKEYKNIDDLFRDKFDDFEVDPPDYIWENVKSKMGGNSDNGSGFNLNKSGIAGLTLLFVTVGIVTFFLINNSFVIDKETGQNQTTEYSLDNTDLIADNSTNDNNNIQALSSDSENSDPNPDRSSVKKEKKEKKSKDKSNISKRNSTFVINPEINSTIPIEKQGRQNLTVTPVTSLSATITEPNKTSGTLLLNSTTNKDEEKLNGKVSDVENSGTQPDMVRGQELTSSVNSGSSGIKSDYGKMGRWKFGLYFTPEMIVYPSDNQLKNYSYSLDINASYKLGSYFLQSGFGFARNHEQGDSRIDYNKYIGSYEDVYNVTFDTTSTGIVPVYETETVFIYDSISHVNISSTKRYYTYLQIPIFIGYGAESKRFGWFVKGGPSLSFLVHEDIPESGMSADEAKILNIENELPGRISTTWQFILSAGATYKLGPRLSFSMEPMFRYYVKSVYEQDKLNTKHPYSIGLRTGFLLNF